MGPEHVTSPLGAGSPLKLRAAGFADVSRLNQLLEEASLPRGHIEEFIENFVVIEDEGAIAGGGGFERYDSSAVLRSVVVEDGLRGRGLGRRIAEALMDKARDAAVTDFCLFTIDSHEFWSRLGFEDVPMSAWPEAAQQCWQYRYVSANWERFEAWGIHSMWKRA
jgi:N-acetylglutamate synthase-like GNAT family acetyltransferase